MEQEEEWEREGLLDPAWEKQQRKVFLTLLLFDFQISLKYLSHGLKVELVIVVFRVQQA